ncbi:MAG: T9SS type B sorting domain-containing protein [Flavobacteriales bacterium]
MTSLLGNPDNGGVWTPALAGGGDIFNPAVDPEGIYTYTVNNSTCGNRYSQIEVVVNNLPNAGEDGILSICHNSLPVDLFVSLNGTPDEGGYWTPTLSSGSGFFDPLLDSPGDYTYNLNNGNCSSASSVISVSILDVFPITDYSINTSSDFSGNNFIEININSNLLYEYSLDGLNYQRNSIFNNLAGGNYNVFVREINGCGRLETKLNIVDYPKYFTPNNDGNNDSWKLKGVVAQIYSIKIYDRYGKLLKNIKNDNIGWDGTFNGKPLPADDYWFNIEFEDGSSFRSHFALKR